MDGLLRFVDPLNGPVLGVQSSIHPSLFRPRYWFSQAKLSVNKDAGAGNLLEGAGWSPHKEESQAKAVVEAIERWAYLEYQNRPEQAGLDWDGSSTGFAAAPSNFGREFVIRNAYHEAVERWGITQLQSGKLKFERLRESESDVLFRRYKGRWIVFGRSVQLAPIFPLKGESVWIVLSLFVKPDGGLIPGSACGRHLESTIERAKIETYNHVRKINRILKGEEPLYAKLSVQRLWHFAFDSKIESLTYLSPKRKIQPNSKELIPKVRFSRRLTGPWDPDVFVHRVVLEDSLPLHLGGVERLMV